MSRCDVTGCQVCKDGYFDDCKVCFRGYVERFRRREIGGGVVRYCELYWNDDQVYSFALWATVGVAVLLFLFYWKCIHSRESNGENKDKKE